MDKKIKTILIVLIVIIILMFFMQLAYKTVRTGNNITKSADDLIEYILNISSYEAKLEITINSNKTTNKYVLEQYYMHPSYSKQIVKEPSNLENLEIIYNGKNLEVKNTNLGLSKIYENYNYLNNNLLWLNSFLSNCRENYRVEENKDEIILIADIERFNYKGKLYINKKNNNPTKLEIIDNNNSSKIYIEYKELKLNNIQENNIFAFVNQSNKEEV